MSPFSSSRSASPSRAADAAPEAGERNARDARLVRRLLPLVLLLAFGLRVAYVLAQRANPYFAEPVMDPLYHLEWARALARGETFQPGAYFRAPLYPWFLGALLRLFGEDLLFVRIVQAGLGTATTGLTYLVGARAFDRRIGLLAALFSATCWVLVYFDGELLIPTLYVPLCLAALWLTLGLAPGPSGRPARPQSALLAGLVWGVAALARPNVLALVPLFGAWLLWSARPAWRRGLGAAAALLLGVAAAVLPVTARNALRGDDLVLVSSQGGVNLYIGNNPRSDGSSAWVPDTPQDWWGGYRATIAIAEAAAGRELRGSEVSRYWSARALDWWREAPGEALALLAWKARLFLLDVELGNNQHVRFFATRYAPFVRFLPLSFAVLLGLGGLGLVVSLRGGSARTPLAVFLVGYSATVIAFFVCARFRVPVLPVLAVYAAHGTLWLVGVLSARRLGPAAAGLALVALLVVQARLVPDGPGRFSRGRVDVSDAAGWLQLGARAMQEGDPAAAERLYRRALAERPRDLYAHRDLASALAAQGRTDEARAELLAALAILPRDVTSLERLANLETEAGRPAAAIAAAERLLAIDPTHVAGLYQLGRAHLAAGSPEPAEAALRRALAVRADFNAGFALGTLFLSLGRPADAVSPLRIAVGARPEPDAQGWLWRAWEALLGALRAAGTPAELEAARAELARRHGEHPGVRALLDRFGG